VSFPESRQRRAKLLNRAVQAIVKIHEVSEDHSLRRISSRVINLAGFSSKTEKDAKRLARQTDADSVLAQFPRGEFTWKTPKRRTLPGEERLRFCTVLCYQGLSTSSSDAHLGTYRNSNLKAWVVTKR